MTRGSSYGQKLELYEKINVTRSIGIIHRAVIHVVTPRDSRLTCGAKSMEDRGDNVSEFDLIPTSPSLQYNHQFTRRVDSLSNSDSVQHASTIVISVSKCQMDGTLRLVRDKVLPLWEAIVI